MSREMVPLAVVVSSPNCVHLQASSLFGSSRTSRGRMPRAVSRCNKSLHANAIACTLDIEANQAENPSMTPRIVNVLLQQQKLLNYGSDHKALELVLSRFQTPNF